MKSVRTLRHLSQHPIAVTLVVIVALLAGGAILFSPSWPPRGKQYTVGVATSNILVDTPSSQVVAVAPRGSGALAQPTSVMASLMVAGPVKAVIAQRAGLRPSQITGVNAAISNSAEGDWSSSSAVGKANAYVLTTQVDADTEGDGLPIIQVTAQAPTEDAAARLAGAATSGLSDYLAKQASSENVAVGDRLRAKDLGIQQVTTKTVAPSDALAALVFGLVLLLGCGAIAGAPLLARGWRAAGGELPLTDPDVVAVQAARGEFEYNRRIPLQQPGRDARPLQQLPQLTETADTRARSERQLR